METDQSFKAQLLKVETEKKKVERCLALERRRNDQLAREQKDERERLKAALAKLELQKKEVSLFMMYSVT